MNPFKPIGEFYRKHRLIILATLTTLVVLHWCSQRGEKLRQAEPSPTEQVASDIPDVAIERPTLPQPSPKANWLPYLLMVGMVLLVFVAQRRGWIEKLIPGMVLVRTGIFRSKENKRRMMRLFIMNTTRTGQTFSEPIVEFLSPGSKNKAFMIHITGMAAFPITLTTNTSHALVIDLDRFYDKMPDLKKYRLVRVKLTINGAKTKKSLPKLVW